VSLGSGSIGAASGSEDPLMERFVEALRQRGFFAGLTEGSPAWAERLAKAQEKFRERQARGGSAAGQGAQAAGNVFEQRLEQRFA
jgi:hypothetical protein